MKDLTARDYDRMGKKARAEISRLRADCLLWERRMQEVLDFTCHHLPCDEGCGAMVYEPRKYGVRRYDADGSIHVCGEMLSREDHKEVAP